MEKVRLKLRLKSRQWVATNYCFRQRVPDAQAHPVFVGGSPSPTEYCHDVWYGKTRMVWLYPTVKKIWRHVYSFWQNSRTDRQTVIQTDTAWRHRPRLHSIARQNCLTFIWSFHFATWKSSDMLQLLRRTLISTLPWTRSIFYKNTLYMQKLSDKYDTMDRAFWRLTLKFIWSNDVYAVLPFDIDAAVRCTYLVLYMTVVALCVWLFV